jgi:Gas vesicle synthesis protein GvpO
MTDQKAGERRRGRPDEQAERHPQRDGARKDGRRRVNAIGAARRAGESLQALIARPVEGVVEVNREDDGWLVAVEVLELARVPNTNDVLGVYEVELDPYGGLQGYRRRNRYVRGSSDSD